MMPTEIKGARLRTIVKSVGLVTAGMALAGSAFAAGPDFGQRVEGLLKENSGQLFGVKEPLTDSSLISLTAAQVNANPASILSVAKGLKVRVVSAAPNLGRAIDQMVLWPNSKRPTP